MATDFTKFNFERLQQFQVRALLSFMGIPAARFNALSSHTLRCNMLREVCVQQPERAEQGLDVIVRGKVPSGVPEDLAKNLELKVLSLLRDHDAGTAGEIASKRVAELTDGLQDKLLTLAKTAIKEAAENFRPIVIKEKGKKDRKVKGVLPEEFKLMVQLGAARKNIMLVGPAGCGKTYLAAKLAEALDLPFADQSCSAGLSESAFTGWLLPVGKTGQFEYVESPFIHIYENGGVFLLDEMDAADANLLTFLNKALANDSFYLPQRHKNPLVKRHPDFVCVGAANTFGHGADAMYVGRNQLDAATLDRFRVGMITMDYSRAVEESLGTPDLLAWAWKVRAAIREKSLRRIMSTRTIKDLADMSTAADWGRADWERAYFADWSDEERNIIKYALEAA